MNTKTWWLLVLTLLLPCSVASQQVAFKTNLLYWATASINIDVETRISDRWTGELSLGYNPFTFNDNKKLKHIAVQPELRRWLCSAFSGHFLAANLLYSHYNVGGIDQPFFKDLKHYRYQGNLGGVGVGYGYNLILSPRWSIEFELTLGMMVTKYSKYDCATCGKKIENASKTFFSPTKIAIDMVYYF